MGLLRTATVAARRMLACGTLALGLLAVAPPAAAQLPAADLPESPAPVATSATSPAAADAAAPDISLLTFGPGSIYWERFGHNAILVGDGPGAVAYNYGIFDFGQEHFFLNFARGYMSYRMAADPLYLDLRMYNDEGRWVMAQHLDLAPAQRIELRDFLRWNARPENTRYRYDYFISNCSTRVRDALDHVLGGALQRQLEGTPTRTSFRSEAVRLISPDRAMSMAMDVVLGPSADRPLNLWQQSFVPMVLMNAVRGVVITDADGRQHPLVDAERQILASRVPDDPKVAPDLRPPLALAGLSLAALLLLLAALPGSRAARLTMTALACAFALLCGLGGLVIAATWGLTEHWAGWRNQNLLLLNPLCLLLLPGWWSLARGTADCGRFARRLATITALLAASTLLLKIVPGVDYQDNLAWIFLLLPGHLALAFIAWRSARRQSARL